jgi:hypothetical protein
MLNKIIDSQGVRAQNAAHSSQSSRSSFIPRRSKERLKIKMFKESLRQWDEYYSQALAQQHAMFKVSLLILFAIEYLAIVSKLIH